MKFLLALSTFLGFFSFAQAQRNYPPNPEPGKCYAKCLITPQPIETVKTYPVYTGSNPEGIALETVELVTENAHKEWVKKGKGNDAVMCMVDVPAVTQTLIVVKDINQTQDYKMTKVLIKESVNPIQRIEWREVICENKVSKKLVSKIQTSLQAAGYYKGSVQGRFNSKTKSALTTYQNDHGLPIGGLNVESIKVLTSK